MARLREILPGIDEHIVVKSSATAMTSFRFTNNWQGAMLGWEMSPEQLGAGAAAATHAGQNLYLIGHWTQPGGGITPVIVSAQRVAGMILTGKDDRQRSGRRLLCLPLGALPERRPLKETSAMSLNPEQERLVLDGAVKFARTGLSSITLDQLTRACGISAFDIVRHYHSEGKHSGGGAGTGAGADGRAAATPPSCGCPAKPCATSCTCWPAIILEGIPAPAAVSGKAAQRSHAQSGGRRVVLPHVHRAGTAAVHGVSERPQTRWASCARTWMWRLRPPCSWRRLTGSC